MFSDTCLHDVVDRWARETPDRVAVTSASGHVTYGELRARADRLAAELVARGVGPDVLVGLYVDRSAEMIVGLLGILKAGGAYVPLDPDYPAQRIEFLLADSAVPVVVSVSRVAGGLDGCGVPVICLDELDGDAPDGVTLPAIARDNLAYVIYTSGSTGTPKGVLVEHRNVLRLFAKTERQFGFGTDDVWSMFHSISFDFSVWEIWGALLYGGRLVVVPGDVARSPEHFLGLIETEGVTMLSQTPSAFRHLIAADARHDGWDSRLRAIVFGGERLDVRLLAPWIARHGDDHPMLVNMYGITETTVHVTYRRVTRADLDGVGVSPIGEPIGDLYVVLLDENGALVPDGQTGEMYVGGAGVARGYLDRPELTAERFLDGVAGATGRVYRTGDRAVRLPGGDLAYLGRVDDQIKVRGFRVEPGEIETYLTADPRVSAAVVASRDYGDGDVRLVAFVLPAAAEPLVTWVGDLAASVATALPVHLRPSTYLAVSTIPLTAHGKVDRTALDSVVVDVAVAPHDDEDVLDDTQRAIRDICAEVLGRPDVPLDIDVFDLGATSLAFIRVLTHINERFDVTVTGPELGDAATVLALAACVETELRNGTLEAIGD